MMSPLRSCRRWLLACLFVAPSALPAQVGYANTGLALGKAQARAGVLPAPEAVVVEEYLNYHRHDLPLPTLAQRVHLDLQVAAGLLPGESLVQVGLSTPFLDGLAGAPPLNLALVIDRSGSMAQQDRMEKAKAALRALIDQLRPTDRVSLIAFDHQVDLLWPSQPLGQGHSLRALVAQLAPRGSTDLSAGITAGYEAVLAHYRPGHTHRLLILTDAIANTGLTDPATIARESVRYQGEWQVDCAMICVGTGFQHGLARTVTATGHNSLYFIDDAEDLQKVFVDEIQSLLAPVAKEVRLSIVLQGAHWQETYGYQAPPDAHRWDLDLPTLNHGLTQVVLGTIRSQPGRTPLYVEARLQYVDYACQCVRTQIQRLPLPAAPLPPAAGLAKTYAIARLAQGLHTAAIAYEQGDSARAQQVLRTALAEQDQLLEQPDPDTQRIAAILRRYVAE